ncbi:NAD(P)-binding domain-containing protein, partial [Streptococcus danieliae]|nr:NAD(P)-binding domain-containing protein [Streptococcus danieliae]
QAVAQVPGHQVLLSNHNPAKAQTLAQLTNGTLLSNQDLVSQADVVFLGVKPYLLASLTQDLAPLAKPETVWISMAAGVS